MKKFLLLVSMLFLSTSINAKEYDVPGIDFQTEIICEQGKQFLVVSSIKGISVVQIFERRQSKTRQSPVRC